MLSDVVGRSHRLRAVPKGSTVRRQRHGPNGGRIGRTDASALERRHNRQSRDSSECHELLNSGEIAQAVASSGDSIRVATFGGFRGNGDHSVGVHVDQYLSGLLREDG